MKINYCLPIIQFSKTEVNRMIMENISEYEYFEIWLDYIGDLSLEFIEELKEKLGRRAIFLFRRQNLEPILMDLEKRKEIIDSLENSESLLDIDIETQPEELKYLKGKNIKTILSYHNYKETPSGEVLNQIINRMREYGPSIYKVSGFCETKDDALRLLRLLVELKKEGLPSIILGMGKEGVVTRIFGTLWGNEMIFAPKSKAEESAPGQLTKERLEKILLELQ